MNDVILFAIRAVSALLQIKSSGEYAALKDDIDALVAKLTVTLPAKPDGSAWTDADIHAAAAAARLPWQEILDRTAAPDGTGHP